MIDSKKEIPQDKQTVAFMFLIYNRIQLQLVWDEFFKYANPDKYTIYFHTKEPNIMELNLNSIVKPIKIPTIDTHYMGLSLVKVSNLLMEEALKN